MKVLFQRGRGRVAELGRGKNRAGLAEQGQVAEAEQGTKLGAGQNREGGEIEGQGEGGSG